MKFLVKSKRCGICGGEMHGEKVEVKKYRTPGGVVICMVKSYVSNLVKPVVKCFLNACSKIVGE